MDDWNLSPPPITQPVRRTAKIVQNGEPGTSQIHWGTYEKTVVGFILSILAGLITVGVPVLIATYKKVDVIEAQQQLQNREAIDAANRAAAAALRTDDKLDQHIHWSQQVLPTLVTKDELDRAIGRRK